MIVPLIYLHVSYCHDRDVQIYRVKILTYHAKMCIDFGIPRCVVILVNNWSFVI